MELLAACLCILNETVAILKSDTIQLLRADPESSEEEHIRIVLAQTEVERVKFVVRSYLRTRLFKVRTLERGAQRRLETFFYLFVMKIEKYARYITTNADVQTRLSQAELDHARRSDFLRCL
jgi:GINS complex subunit 4